MFDSEIKRAGQIDLLYVELLHEIKKLVLRGGKRLRPQLAYLAYVGAGGKHLDAIIDVAAAWELMHVYLLMHDDVIDEDVVRNGGPNIIGVYKKHLLLRHNPKQEHLANSMSILAGDIVASLANQAVLESDFTAAAKNAVTLEMHRTLLNVTAGQELDILFSGNSLDDDPSQIIKIARYKTASYTTEGPVKTGLILAGASQVAVDRSTNFSVPFGIAYQLQNDLLGTFGDENLVGKSVLSDLREGKYTLLIWLTMKRADKDQRRLLEDKLGSPDVTLSDLEEVKSCMTKLGVKGEAEAMIKRYLDDAAAAVPSLRLTHEASQELLNLVEQCRNRKA